MNNYLQYKRNIDATFARLREFINCSSYPYAISMKDAVKDAKIAPYKRWSIKPNTPKGVNSNG